MRARGARRSPEGLGTSDHICWSFDDDEARRAGSIAFLQEGLPLGLRLVHTADAPAEALVADLAGMPDRDALLASGQLLVVPLSALYDLDRPIDVARQTAAYEAALAEALAAGWRGLRAVSDGTTFLAAPDRRASLRAWELAADRWMAGGKPVSCLCTCDARRVDAEGLAEMHHVHPGAVAAEDPASFRVFGTADGLALDGEVDAFSTPALRRILRGAPDLAGTRLDLGGLRFADHHALEALGEAVARATGPVTITGAGGVVQRMWGLLGLPAARWA